MSYIVNYQKYITKDTSKVLNTPEGSTELCTIGGTTYVSIPKGLDIPIEQPEEIESSINLTPPTKEELTSIRKESPHVQLINERVINKIRDRYSVDDELKEIKNSSSESFREYSIYTEECRAWGREQKETLGVGTKDSNHLRGLTRRQFKLVLLKNSILIPVEEAISNIEDVDLKANIGIEYNEATGFDRESASVIYMQQMLGLTDEQLDTMWLQGLSL